MLIVDDELSPPQQRTLENALQARVVDRTQLILDIFAQHAVERRGKAPGRARAARVQPAADAGDVAAPRAARRRHRRPRRRRRHRGPGESQLETDRRLARRRITLLRERLRKLSRQRDVRRKERRRTETPTVALAGYTNAGKSTLLNALTDAGVSVRDRLFETLDPTTRGFEHEGRRYLVTDTVGFVRRLPHQLVEGFAATLEETLVADLVLHVVDGSASEQQARRADRRRRRRPARDRRDRAARRARRQQDRRRRHARPPPAREPLPGRAADLRAHRRGARGAAGADRRALRRAVRARAAAPAVRRGGTPQRALRARRADRGAGGHGGGRPRRRAPAAPRAAPLRALPRRRGGCRERGVGRAQ